MMRSGSKIALFLALLLAGIGACAQSYSYIYIQGDKELPFYVKIKGQMMPRYGKNYNIISCLSGGPVEIEILFEQNKLPPQKFTVDVPEHGERAFLLNKNGAFYALYDLRQKKYVDR